MANEWMWIQGAEWGVAITLAAYAVASLLRGKIRWMHPLVTSSLMVIALLLGTGIDYDEYRIGGDLIVFFLGPATVALGVPIYKHSRRIRENIGALLGGVFTGAAVSVLAGWFIAVLCGLSGPLLYSLLPKSASSAISVALSEQLGGIPELTAVLTVLTGLLGSVFGPLLLRTAGVRMDIPIGTAIGTVSHGIGTARVVRDSELQGSISALAMGLSGIVTTLLMLPFYWFL